MGTTPTPFLQNAPLPKISQEKNDSETEMNTAFFPRRFLLSPNKYLAFCQFHHYRRLFVYKFTYVWHYIEEVD